MDKIIVIFKCSEDAYYRTTITTNRLCDYAEINDLREELFTKERFDNLIDKTRLNLAYGYRLYNHPIQSINNYKIHAVIIQTKTIEPDLTTIVTTRRYELKEFPKSTRYKLKSYTQTLTH